VSNVVKVIQIPDMNPVRFVKDNDPFASSTIINSDWFMNKQQGSFPVNYYQKWRFDSYVAVQIYLGGKYYNSRTQSRLQVLDCNGKVLGERAAVNISVLPGNIEYVDGVPYTLATCNYWLNFQMFTNKPGKYYLRLAIAHTTDIGTEYDYHVSEPLQIAKSWDHTLLLEYISYSNKLQVDYRQTFFHLLVEGVVKVNTVPNELSDYSDQNMNPHLQDSIPYREWIHKFGWKGGVPMWMLDKVNRAYSNDLTLVGSQAFKRAPGAQIEITGKVPRYERFGASLLIREQDNVAASKKIGKDPVILFESNFYPYLLFLGSMKNNDSSYKVDFIPLGYEIRNQQEEILFLQYCNSTVAASKGLKGFFYRTDNGFIAYQNGNGENFDTTLCELLLKNFYVNYKSSNYAINPALSIKGTKFAIVPRENNTVFAYKTNGGYFIDFLYYAPTNLDSTAQYRVYHNDTITDIYVYSQTLESILPLSGNMPTSLLNFDVNGGTNSGGYIPPSMLIFPLTLQHFSIRNAYMINPPTNLNRLWTHVNYWDFSGNKYSSATVDSIYNNIANGGVYAPQFLGVFNTKYQTPAAPPTGASAVARTFFGTTYGWQIIKD
jgi:hypothetical protein